MCCSEKSICNDGCNCEIRNNLDKELSEIDKKLEELNKVTHTIDKEKKKNE